MLRWKRFEESKNGNVSKVSQVETQMVRWLPPKREGFKEKSQKRRRWQEWTARNHVPYEVHYHLYDRVSLTSNPKSLPTLSEA